MLNIGSTRRQMITLLGSAGNTLFATPCVCLLAKPGRNAIFIGSTKPLWPLWSAIYLECHSMRFLQNLLLSTWSHLDLCTWSTLFLSQSELCLQSIHRCETRWTLRLLVWSFSWPLAPHCFDSASCLASLSMTSCLSTSCLASLSVTSCLEASWQVTSCLATSCLACFSLIFHRAPSWLMALKQVLVWCLFGFQRLDDLLVWCLFDR